jgi:hypothetical protein
MCQSMLDREEFGTNPLVARSKSDLNVQYKGVPCVCEL